MTAEQGYLPAMLNPFEPGFFDNPYAQYNAVREQDPVHRTPLGPWAIFRYGDVLKILRDPNLSVEEQHATPVPISDPEKLELLDGRTQLRSTSMLDRDPPDHHRLRRLVSKVFTPRMIEELRPRIREIVQHHLDAMDQRGANADVIDDLAFPLPFMVISEMMGIPEGRSRADLRDWSGALVKTFDPTVDANDVRAAMLAGDNMFAFLEEVVNAKRVNPTDDLTYGMIAAEEDGDRLTTEELISNIALLFIAGHETTVNLIGNGTLALLRNRSQFELWHNDSSLDTNAVDELLRYDGPVQFSRRIAINSFELDSHTIDAGSVLMVCLAAGNRDPAMFGSTADTLDLQRANANQHLTFGGGFHHCLGNALARVEGQEAIGGLVRRFPDMGLATDTLDWNGRIVIRGLNHLPVTLR